MWISNGFWEISFFAEIDYFPEYGVGEVLYNSKLHIFLSNEFQNWGNYDIGMGRRDRAEITENVNFGWILR